MTSTESSKPSSNESLERSGEHDVELPEEAETEVLELDATTTDSASKEQSAASENTSEETVPPHSSSPAFEAGPDKELDSLYGRPGGVEFSDELPVDAFHSPYGELPFSSQPDTPADFRSGEEKKQGELAQDMGAAFGSPVPAFLGPLGGAGAGVISPVPQGGNLLATPLATEASEKSLAVDDLADAVQNALRNIYGPDLAGTGSSILTPGQPRRLDLLEANGPQSGRDIEPAASVWNDMAHYERREPYSGSVAELDESTTEAVLSYLYNHDSTDLRSSPPRETHFRAEMDRDQRRQAQNGYQPYWDEPRVDADAPPIRARSYGATATEQPLYRGEVFRAPSQVPPQPAEQGVRPYEARERTTARNDASPQAASGTTGVAAYDNSATSQLQERESGRLLGAAGLGLIGGIALAGVMSVFLFNSFVTKPNSGDAENFLPSTSSEPSATAAANAANQSQPFRVADVSGQAGSPIALSIAVDERYRSDNTLISLKGLPGQARLSAGIDAGGGIWLLPPQRLAGLQLILPSSITGSVKLEAQLMQADARTPLSEPKSFIVNLGNSNSTNNSNGSPSLGDGISQDAVAKALAAMQSNADRTGGFANESSGQRSAAIPPSRSSDPVKSQQLVRDGNKLMREGDILAARKLYDQAYALGDVDGALAMGRSFDPSYFEQLQVKTGKPDPAQAFEWYRKALDGGVDSARVKIDNLKQWLLR